MTYEVSTDGDLLWKVVRETDRKVMKRGVLRDCLRWVVAWGDVDLGR